MAVECVLVINNYGKPRLANFYRSLSTPRQQLLIRTIFKLVNDRPEGECNVLEAPELDALLARSAAKSKASGVHAGEGASNSTSAGRSRNEMKVIYRHYATLWFVFVVDQSESELAILDLIQVFVESLDRFFPNVCELDLIFHYEEVNAILCEVIQGGIVLETNIAEIVRRAQATSKARKASAAQASGTSVTGPFATGTGFDVGLNAASAAAGWARGWINGRSR
ncbi:unnamed protein product [Jaminaea pallidilutea]